MSQDQRKYTITYLMLLMLIGPIFLFFTCRTISIEEFVNLRGLRNNGDDWKVIGKGAFAEGGFIKLHHDKWLMYFLHWRPLTEDKRTLTLKYVRNHMLNFWDEAMDFELTEIEGEIEICGHKGFFTEGTLSKGAIYTRFIVWNCPQTNRQFTADCNINVRRGTPKDLLELQNLVTKTVRCHKNASQPKISGLNKKYESQRWNLIFNIPENWRTADFNLEDWFPQGMTEQNGSLWTLLTDSEKHVELLWEDTDAEISPFLFNKFLKLLTTNSSIPKGLRGIFNIQLDYLDRKNGYYLGEGTYQYNQYRKGKFQPFEYKFKGLLWKKGKRIYFLLASLIQIKEFWGIKNDLSPSTETLEKYLKDEIIPNIKVFDKRL